MMHDSVKPLRGRGVNLPVDSLRQEPDARPVIHTQKANQAAALSTRNEAVADANRTRDATCLCIPARPSTYIRICDQKAAR